MFVNYFEKCTLEAIRYARLGARRAQIPTRNLIRDFGGNLKDTLTKMISQIELTMIEDTESVTVSRPFVNKLFPNVKPTTVRDFVETRIELV